MTIVNNCDNCLYLSGQDVDTMQYTAFKANRTVDSILTVALGDAYLFTRGISIKMSKSSSSNCMNCTISNRKHPCSDFLFRPITPWKPSDSQRLKPSMGLSKRAVPHRGTALFLVEKVEKTIGIYKN